MHSLSVEMQDESLLWQRLSQGDQQALSTIFSAHYSDLFHYFVRIFRDEQLVENCIQETFYALWKSRRSLGEIQSVRVYLKVSLRRCILRTLTRERKRKSLTGFLTHKAYSFSLSPEDIRIEAEMDENRQQELKTILHSLPARQQEVLYLYYYEELSHREIAQMLSLSSQTVMNHLHRAYQSLRQNPALKQLAETLLLLFSPALLLA